MKTINACLVDIGNVLLSFDFMPFLLKTGPQNDPSFNHHQAFEKILPLRNTFESGALTESEFFTACKPILQYEGDWQSFRTAYCEIFHPVQAMWEWVEHTAKTKHMVLFSNISPTHFHYLRETYPILSLFHDRVLSYETGAIKPEPPMYLDAIKRIGLNPQHTLYIDDRPENIRQGAEFGFLTHTYDFNNHDALHNQLQYLNLND